jgi:hypothetical protein
LHEHGCPWNKRTCYAVSRKNAIEILNWAFQNGCPCSYEIFPLAVRESKTEVLEWAYKTAVTFPEIELPRARSD